MANQIKPINSSDRKSSTSPTRSIQPLISQHSIGKLSSNENRTNENETTTAAGQAVCDRDLNERFNSYASVKTYANGFFNLALVTTNAVQLKQLIEPMPTATITQASPSSQVNDRPLNVMLITFVCMSLLLQLVVAVLLVFLARRDEFVDEAKRMAIVRGNNWATLLISTVSIINIFINIFISV